MAIAKSALASAASWRLPRPSPIILSLGHELPAKAVAAKKRAKMNILRINPQSSFKQAFHPVCDSVPNLIKNALSNRLAF